MRALCLGLMLLTTLAAANGTIVNAPHEDAPSLVKLAPSSKIRLQEIDDELYGLEVRPTGSQVFVKTVGTLYPWFLAGGIPLMVLGAALGVTQQTGTRDQAVSVAAFGGLIVLGVVAVSLLLVCTFRVVDHWMEEADGAREREVRMRVLRTERQQLELN